MTSAKNGRESKSKKEPKKAIGRPRAVSSPEQFDTLVDSYIELCRNANEPILLTGLILSLGLTSKEGFYEYQNYDGFSDSVKRARLLIESEYEKRMVTGTNAASSIFALKNFGWMDKHPTSLDDLQAEKLKRELALTENGLESTPESVTIIVKDASKQ